MPDGIELILADHRTVSALFDQFEATQEGYLVGMVIDMLHAHDDAEQAALYPLAGNILGDVDLIHRSALAHSAVKKQIEIITSTEGAALVESFRELRVLVEEHVADEEQNLLPALAAKATPQQLEGLGARILQAKQRVG